ncbi:centrosomal protein of 290 kDa-like [Penaeus chinensis]|uniref:centrosomal protein of 290 kDa-like n=1 Tax=Penaeus chinensis TaxID=139456 RepID=UPI001FB624E8|nr:centrosomal protein of 290 kDa-like [Penaeus chinensis]
MGVDWEYLRGVTGDAGEWKEADLEELFQSLASVTKLRPRDKTPEKLELLFTLTQAVMMTKYSQVVTLEEEVGRLAESAGRGDAQREQELQAEIKHLKKLLKSSQIPEAAADNDVPYDWSSGWKIKKKEMEEALQRKNEEIQQFMDDLQTCENERASLRMAVMELEDRLADATKEINRITSDYIGVKESHNHAQESLSIIREEVKGLHCQVEELAAEKSFVQEKYDELSTAVDARVDQLKIVISQREEELQRVKAQLFQRSSLGPSFQQAQSDMSHILHLEQEVKERDEEITRLSQQLAEATQEIESSAVIINKLKKSRVSAVEGDAAVINQLRGELHETQQQVQQMRTQLLAAEEDAQLHAQDLSTVIGELQSYMAGEFSLADAVRELKEARSQVRIRDSQITQLTALANTLQININDLLEENGSLREQLKLEPREDIDIPGVKKTDWQNSKKIIEQLTNQVNRLQDEKVNLRTKVFELTRELSNAKGSVQFTTLELPRQFASGQTSVLQTTQPLEEQLNHLSAAVAQLVQGQQEGPVDDQLHQKMEALKEKCLRLEGEKASLEKILLESQRWQKKRSDSDRTSESSVFDPKREMSKDEATESASKSPVAALDELIAALGKLPPSTEEVIAKLKNQVNFLIQECNKREQEIDQREKASLIYTNQFDDLRTQVTDLNTQFAKDRDEWQAERKSLEESISLLEETVKAEKARTEELNSTIDAISSGRSDVDGRLAKRTAELRYDLVVTKRLSNNQGKEITTLHNRLRERNEELQQRILQNKQARNEIEQEQGLSKLRVQQLERELSQMVPRTVADQTSAQMAAITTKYRALLQDQARMKENREQGVRLEAEVKQLLEEREQLSQHLESAREKVHSLQASLNLVGANVTNVQVEVLSKQLAAVELRELREKQKAEHATTMFHNVKKECDDLYQRVKELQNTVETISKMNSTLQMTETELRCQLQSVVSREDYERVIQHSQQVTEEKAKLALDVKRLQGLLEVNTYQMKQREFVEAVDKEEMEQLRQKAHDLAAISEERTKIGELHQDIVYLKVKNLELIAAQEEAKAANEKLSVEISRMRQQLRDRDRLLKTATDSSRSRATRLHVIIRDLRQQYAGAIPLHQQERLVDLMETLKQERNTLQVALQKTQHDKMEAKVTLRQLKLKQEALDELKTALTSPKSTKHVADWCSKLEEAKLRNVELEEKTQMLEEERALTLVRLEGKERKLSELYSQIASVEKMWMDEQLVWEEREAELMRALEKHETRHQEALLGMKTLGFHDLPDQKLPLSKQLDQAQDMLRNKSTLIEGKEKELEECQQKIEKLVKELRDKEVAVIAREKIINELRLQGSSLKKPWTPRSVVQESEENERPKMVPPEEESIKVVMEGLKERLRLSQEAVNHYQDLLAKTHKEQQQQVAKQKEEYVLLAQERDELVAKLRDLHSQLDSIPTRDTGSHALNEAQTAQIHSLEDVIKTLETRLEETKSQLMVSEGKVMHLERELTVSRHEHSEEREHLEVSGQVKAQQHQREVDRLSGEINNIRRERDDLRKEVALLKESANRTPSVILRTLVEKLRDQLIEKEKQVAKLSQAVQEMKEKIMLNDDKQENTVRDEEKEPISIEKEVAQATSRATETIKSELKKVHEAKKELEQKLQNQTMQISSLKEKNSEEINKLNVELKSLKTHNLKLEKQTLQQKRANSTMKQKLEDLEGKSPMSIARAIENLREKLEKMNATHEIEENEAKKTQQQEQIIRWEERKKLRGTIDKLKARVKELEEAQGMSQKKLEASKDLLSRVEKEKLIVQHKLNTMSRVSTEQMCGVCLKALNPLEMGNISTAPDVPPAPRTSRSTSRSRKNRVSPSPDRREGGVVSRVPPRSPKLVKKTQTDQDESEVQFRSQLKQALEEKHKLETRLKGAVEEITALRVRLQQKEEEEERLIVDRSSPVARRVGGAAVVLEYESRIASLEEEVRQKTRLLAHVKQVVREAAAREEVLMGEKDVLLQKVTLLESVSEDTPAAHLVHELRQAKLTVNRQQRLLEHLHGKS